MSSFKTWLKTKLAAGPGRLNRRRPPQPDVVQQQLLDLATELDRLNRSAEPRFIELGSAFQSLYMESAELASTVEQVGTSLCRDAEGSVLQDLENLLHTTFADLRQRHESLAQAAGNVETMSKAISQVQSAVHGAGRLALRTQSVATGIAIESSRQPEAQELFGDFAVGVRQLSSRVEKLLGEIEEECSGINATVIHSRDALVTGSARVAELTGDAETAVRDSMVKIGELSDNAGETLATVLREVQRLSSLTEDVVVGLQFNDIVRQKIEHIIEALQGGLADRTPAEIMLTLAVQRAQLNVVIGEIDEVKNRVCGAFSEIKALNASIIACARRLVEINGESDAPSAPINNLNLALQHLNLLCTKADHLGTRASAASEEAVASSEQLSSTSLQVRRLSIEIQRHALNAVVKADRLGDDGRALDTLAREVAAIARQTSEVSDAVVDAVSRTEDLSQAIRTASDDQGCSGSEAAARMQAVITSTEDTRTSIIDSSEKATRLQEGTTAASAHLQDFLVGLVDDFKASETVLTDLIETYEEAGVDARQEGVSLDDHAARYTMETEREVHRNISAAGDGPAAAPAPDPEPDIELFDDEDGGAVELFDDEDTSAVELFDDDDAGTVELFDDSADDTPAPVTPDGDAADDDGQDFGDNVDLF